MFVFGRDNNLDLCFASSFVLPSHYHSNYLFEFGSIQLSNPTSNDTFLMLLTLYLFLHPGLKIGVQRDLQVPIRNIPLMMDFIQKKLDQLAEFWGVSREDMKGFLRGLQV